jgi:peptide chain release factor 1
MSDNPSPLLDKLGEKERRFDEISEDLADPEIVRNSSQYQRLARELGELREVVDLAGSYRGCLERRADAVQIIAEADDAELVELASEELRELDGEIGQLEAAIQLLLIPTDPNAGRNAIVEIRAGTGGDEAGLFASDLFRMYHRFAERNSWKTEPLSSSTNPSGGFKEVVFMVSGASAYGKLKFESGVHRVQRVPKTEASGRIHTSAASVAVLPEADDIDVEISPEEIEVDVYRSSGPGGQSVNTTDSAVRITHKPTGMVVSCQDEKSQLKNKNKAMKVLRARLLDQRREEQEAELSRERRQQIGSGDRSAKIRTYNFPQGRVTDHRIGLSIYRLDGVLDGELDEFLDKLAEAEQGDALAS